MFVWMVFTKYIPYNQRFSIYEDSITSENSNLIKFYFALNSSFSQTAMDFNTNDCNGNMFLFSDLDAGKALILIYYMPN